MWASARARRVGGNCSLTAKPVDGLQPPHRPPPHRPPPHRPPPHRPPPHRPPPHRPHQAGIVTKDREADGLHPRAGSLEDTAPPQRRKSVASRHRRRQVHRRGRQQRSRQNQRRLIRPHHPKSGIARGIPEPAPEDGNQAGTDHARQPRLRMRRGLELRPENRTVTPSCQQS